MIRFCRIFTLFCKMNRNAKRYMRVCRVMLCVERGDGSFGGFAACMRIVTQYESIAYMKKTAPPISGGAVESTADRSVCQPFNAR